jgi:NodT family efflux transporter outer membrane factor (OMF) lipoprotein
MNIVKCLMSLYSPAGDEIALTPALSHQNGRGSFSIQRAPDVAVVSYPRPRAGEGRVRVHSCLSRVFIGLAMVVLLSGCLVGPDYNRPSVATPAAFRGNTLSDAQSIADLKWFEIFKDEQLQDLIRTALVQNYDLRDAIARVEAARANLGITRADQFPNIGLGGGVTSTEQSTNGQFTIPKGSSFFSRRRTYGEIFLNLFTFEIDIWGRLRRATEAARAQLLSSDWNRKTVITTLISDVATAYFSLLELDMELAISKNTLDTRQESLRLIRIQQQGGVGTLLDVRQAEQLVYTATESILNAERQMEQTENQISLLLGRNPGPVTRVRSLTEQQILPELPPGLPSALLERRPDIQAAEQLLIAANANIGVAKAAYFPQITLTGEFGYQSTALAGLFSGSRRIWSSVPQLTYPIFDAGRIRSELELAEADQRSSLAQYEKAIQTGFQDVSNALVQYQRIREIRLQQELLVTALQDRKRLAYLRYRGGVDTMLNALQADQDLFSAELTLAQNRRDELLSVVQLYKALGGGWD